MESESIESLPAQNEGTMSWNMEHFKSLGGCEVVETAIRVKRPPQAARPAAILRQSGGA